MTSPTQFPAAQDRPMTVRYIAPGEYAVNGQHIVGAEAEKREYWGIETLAAEHHLGCGSYRSAFHRAVRTGIRYIGFFEGRPSWLGEWR